MAIVDKQHKYYAQFKQEMMDLDITTIDVGMQSIVDYLRTSTDVITRYCCEGHIGKEEYPMIYLMCAGSNETLNNLALVMYKANVLYHEASNDHNVKGTMDCYPYELEVSTSIILTDETPYISYTLRSMVYTTLDEYTRLINVLEKAIKAVL